jgi:uncharacterized protein (DUF1330 family)
MSAYLILDIDVLDPQGYKDYVKLATESVKLYGGKYLVRGGANESLEGNWQAKRLVVLEFPSAKQARSWLTSSEYAPARQLRHQYAKTNMVIVDGV